MEKINKKMNDIERETRRLQEVAEELESKQDFLEKLTECVTHGHAIEMNPKETSTTLEEVLSMGVWCRRCGCYSISHISVGAFIIPNDVDQKELTIHEYLNDSGLSQ